MPTLDDVFAKFGVTAEAGQLLEIEIGNLLISDAVKLHGFDKVQNKVLARKIVGEIDRKTLGQLIRALRKSRAVPQEFEGELEIALTERNRLNHSFFLEHNIRKNSDEGRRIMLADLEVIHERIFRSYIRASGFSTVSVSAETLEKAQSGHLPLKPQR